MAAEAVNIPVAEVRRSADQVRKIFHQEAIEGLASSIDQVGLLHPILVRAEGSTYRLVAGERRLLATLARGEPTIAATVLSEDVSVRQVQLVENLQREDLNPIERAMAVRDFMHEHGLSKKAVGERLGIPRTTLTDWLDLVDVPERYQRAVVDNFYGGDSPLTASHVSEALALASRLGSPGLSGALLDAVLLHKLSKAETRQVAQMVRENREVSIEQAITAMRFSYSDGPDAAGDETPLDPHEENLLRLVYNLQRSTSYLEQMSHLSGRFLHEEQRQRLAERFSELAELADRARRRILLEDEELLAQIAAEEAALQPRRRKGNKSKKKGRRVS